MKFYEAGTGYDAALMAHVVGDSGQVITVDVDEDLPLGARRHLAPPISTEYGLAAVLN